MTNTNDLTPAPTTIPEGAKTTTKPPMFARNDVPGRHEAQTFTVRMARICASHEGGRLGHILYDEVGLWFDQGHHLYRLDDCSLNAFLREAVVRDALTAWLMERGAMVWGTEADGYCTTLIVERDAEGNPGNWKRYPTLLLALLAAAEFECGIGGGE